jgi:tetratricopeptide (TPR) repeat protein
MEVLQKRDRLLAEGERLYNAGNIAGAKVSFRLAIESDPLCPQAHAQLSWCLVEPRDALEAIQHLRIASDLDPSSEKVLESLGKLLVQVGKFEEAEEIFRKVLELNPRSATSLCGVVGCRKMTQADRALVERIAIAAADPNRVANQRAHLHHAAGKAYDDMGEHEVAMEHFDASNGISERLMIEAGESFNAAALRSYVSLLIDTFTPEIFTRFSALGSTSGLPVLIVGMIRSGTTLTDQLLCRHPKIASAGELNYWTGSQPGSLMRQLLIGRIDRKLADEICHEYRLVLRKAGGASRRIIDKMPMNFLGLGLFHLLFPQARIIHCRRHPVDTCLSIYCTELGASRPNFAVSRPDIVFMYRQYLRVMAHWRNVLPSSQFLEVDYESLTIEPELELRRLVDFLGLEWDSACLDQRPPETVVTTPSAWQARQPIYRTSIERWRKYEPWLGEFAELFPNELG